MFPMKHLRVIIELLYDLNFSNGVAMDLLKWLAYSYHYLWIVSFEEIDILPLWDVSFFVFVRIAMAEVSQLPIALLPEIASQHFN